MPKYIVEYSITGSVIIHEVEASEDKSEKEVIEVGLKKCYEYLDSLGNGDTEIGYIWKLEPLERESEKHLIVEKKE
jgi:hypothetical protein